MKRLLLALLPVLLAAAPWDGTKGDLTLTTFSNIPGQTTFTVVCSNPIVTGIRFKIVFASGDMSGTITKWVSLNPRVGRWSGKSTVSFVLPVEEAAITERPEITELFDGPTIAF